MFIQFINSENFQLGITLEVYRRLCLENSVVERGIEVRHTRVELIMRNPFGGLSSGTAAPNFSKPYMGGYHMECPEPYFRPRIFYTFNGVELLKINMDYAKNDGLDQFSYAEYYGCTYGPFTARKIAHDNSFTVGLEEWPGFLKRPLTRFKNWAFLPFFTWVHKSIYIPHSVMRVLRFGAGYASYGIRIFQGCYAVNSVIRWLRLHKWTYRRTWYFYPLRLMGMMTDRWHNYWL